MMKTMMIALTTAAAMAAPQEATMKKPKRVLIVMTSHDEKGSTGQATGAYLPEVSHPYDAFVAAGITVEFASIKGGKVPLDGIDLKDDSMRRFMGDAPLMQRLHSSASTKTIADARYDAVFLAGGHGTMWDFADDQALASLVAQTYEHGGVVGAVCHGPAGLVNAKLRSGVYLVANRDVSSFTDEEEDAVGLTKVVPFLLQSTLASRGARMKPAAKWAKQVVVSERLVTGQNPASARGVADEMVKLLLQ
jgi:putative intracellular protease/amidase